jgi:hypothetical protein
MTRYVNALLVFLMVLSAAAVYDMKYEAEVAESTIAGLTRDIANEQADISLLKAEWSVLTQPARLQDLVDRYHEFLQLQPLTPNQIGSLVDIPEKPVEIEPETAVPLPEDAALVQRSARASDPAEAATAMVR